MARSEFGGVMAAWVVTPSEPDEVTGVQTVVLPAGSTTLTVYDAPDGAVVTDLLDASGAAVSSITVPAGSPYIPRFSGPDGMAALWVQAEGGTWVPVPPFETTAGGGGGGGSGDVLLAGGNVHEYADSQSPPWLIIRRPNDNSDSGTWSNLFVFEYFDSATSQYRQGFYVNEKGLPRGRGTTPTDVLLRIMAHPTLGSNVPVFEMTPSDNTIKLVQWYLGQAVFNIPVVVPYVVNPLGERLYFGTADPSTDPAYEDYRPNVGAAWIDYNNPPG